MERSIGQILEGTMVLIVLFLIVRNASSFSQVVGSISGAYVSSVKALQGQ